MRTKSVPENVVPLVALVLDSEATKGDSRERNARSSPLSQTMGMETTLYPNNEVGLEVREKAITHLQVLLQRNPPRI